MRKTILLSLIILLSFLIVKTVSADGWHTSDISLHLYEPSQKAAISWDGKTETMILSSAVKSDDLANFAWVIPIQSLTKPEVTAGNMEIFMDLINALGTEEMPFGEKAIQTGGMGGVAVIESKAIDIYDITTLKATSSDDLINWLNTNGYKVPAEAKPILDKYISQENFYFIANKIDLKNKYKEAIDFIEKFNQTRSVSKTYARDVDEKLLLGIIQFKNPPIPDTLIDSIISHIIANIPFDVAKNNFTNTNKISDAAFMFFPKDDYEKLRSEYGIQFDEKIISFDKTAWHDQSSWTFLPSLAEIILNCVNTSYRINISSITPDGVSDIYMAYGTQGNLDLQCNKTIYAGSYKDVVSQFGSSEIAKDKISKIPFEKIRENIKIVLPKVRNILESETMTIRPMEQKLRDLMTTRMSLKQGVTTPLKFVFQPKQPYYPLEISSLNSGKSLIEVYVLAKDPVKDQNNLLMPQVSRKITDSEVRRRLGINISMDNVEYATRLSYNGDLNKLNADAVFTKGKTIELKNENPAGNIFKPTGMPIVKPVEKLNILQRIGDWLVNLFKNIFRR